MLAAFFRHSIFFLYGCLWRTGNPFLRLNARLSEGFEQRTLQVGLPSADIWIQAASAGESHLALLLVHTLRPRRPVRVLVTTSTQQGMETIRNGLRGVDCMNMTIFAAYFPFDAPGTMRRAVDMVLPKVMVLVESEIWPGLLAALARRTCRVLIANGRITKKSLRRYLLWPSFWRSVAPLRILAVSEADARRFEQLFGAGRVGAMPNMKFDRITPDCPKFEMKNGVANLIKEPTPFVVLGSVRKQEEQIISRVILDVMHRSKGAVLGVFPRHMHRIAHWENRLEALGVSWRLRSECEGPVRPNTVILWDVFGELPAAYSAARAAFVGGSLVPLGGQNFLEALTCGVSPVIGPSWENFYWVGQGILENGLVKVAEDWKAASDLLIQDLEDPPVREQVKKAVFRYVKARQGGTAHACKVIQELLENE